MSGEYGVWEPAYLSQGPAPYSSAGWYATMLWTPGGYKIAPADPFATEAECREWCEKKNAEGKP